MRSRIGPLIESVPKFIVGYDLKSILTKKQSRCASTQKNNTAARALLQAFAHMMDAPAGSTRIDYSRLKIKEIDWQNFTNCRIFDPKYYRSKYQDIVGDDVHAVKHFVLHGQFEGRKPSIYFDPDFYKGEKIRIFEDRSDGTCEASDFLHYLTHGWTIGLNPSPLFATNWYLENNQDVAALDQCPLYHFAAFGLAEGRPPAPDVDLNWYISNYGIDTNDRHSAYESMFAFYPARATSESDYNTRCKAPAADPEGWNIRIIFEPDPERRALQDVAPEEPIDHVSDVFSNIDRSELITIDIWDTILRRDCHPDEIKLQSARYFYIQNYTCLRMFYKDVGRLLAARLQSEAATAFGEDREFELINCLRHWATVVLDPGTRKEDVDSIVQQLLNHELTAEKRSTRLDRPAARFIAQQAKPIVFISDFYATRHFIKAILDHHGLRTSMMGGYVSSEFAETKRSGKLFRRVQEDFEISPQQWIHIGDNETSDYRSPRSIGIQSRLYANAAELERTRWFAKGFEDYRRGHLSVHETRIASLIAQHASSYQAADDIKERLRQIGAQFAIIAVGFILSVVEDAISQKIRRIFFLTREGLFFQRLAQTIIESDPYNTKYPDLLLLEASRISTFAASLEVDEPRALMRMWSQYSTQSLKDFSTSLGLDHDAMQGIGLRHAIAWLEKIQYPWRDKRFKNLLHDPDFVALLKRRVTEQSVALKTYLRATGFGELSSAVEMIVDVGWRGTIQDNIARLTATPIRGHYLGLFRFLNAQPKFSHKIGYLFDDNEARSHCGIADEVAPFEMIYNTLGGSVLEYAQDGEACAARRLIEPGEEKIIAETISYIQEGMLACAPIICRYVRLHGLVAKDLLNLSRAAASTLCSNPPSEIADAFFSLKHNESFGAGEIQDMGVAVDRISDHIDINSLTSSETNYLLSELVSESRWKTGLFATTKLARVWETADPYHRLALPSSFYIARTPRLRSLRGQSVSIYCPQPIAGSGGHRTIFNVARSLARFGFDLQCFTDGAGDGLELIEEWLNGTPAHLYSSWQGHFRAEFALATVAYSAQFVSELPHVKHKGYLVQDLESLFNPVGDGYLIAENSYHHGLRHYTIGNWLAHRLNLEYSSETVSAGLGVDTDIYRIDPSVGREKAVCFLYQPNKWRRLPQTTLEALKIVHAQVPEAKIYMFGSGDEINPGFEVEHLGMVDDLRALNKIYNTCEVGLCLSMSNPSRIPFEMMSAGCIPVDLYRNNNIFDYVDESAVLAYQSAESIADAIVRLLTTDEAELNRLRETARSFASRRSLAWESETIANHIVSQINGENFSQIQPKPTYKANPHLASIDNNPRTHWFCSRQLGA